jgi:hypothetical protein
MKPRFGRFMWFKDSKDIVVSKYVTYKDELRSVMEKCGYKKYYYTPPRNRFEQRLPYVLVLIDKGCRGCYVLTETNLCVNPKLNKSDKYNGNLLKNVLDDIHSIIYNSKKPWSGSNASPKLFTDYLSEYFHVGRIYTKRKLIHIDVYALTKLELQIALNDGLCYSNKSWYKHLINILKGSY